MTSIQWLIEKLGWNNRSDAINRIVDEAKELHKKDIENAFNDGRRWNNSWTGETYYKELFENPNTLGR